MSLPSQAEIDISIAETRARAAITNARPMSTDTSLFWRAMVESSDNGSPHTGMLSTSFVGGTVYGHPAMYHTHLHLRALDIDGHKVILTDNDLATNATGHRMFMELDFEHFIELPSDKTIWEAALACTKGVSEFIPGGTAPEAHVLLSPPKKKIKSGRTVYHRGVHVVFPELVLRTDSSRAIAVRANMLINELSTGWVDVVDTNPYKADHASLRPPHSHKMVKCKVYTKTRAQNTIKRVPVDQVVTADQFGYDFGASSSVDEEQKETDVSHRPRKRARVSAASPPPTVGVAAPSMASLLGDLVDDDSDTTDETTDNTGETATTAELPATAEEEEPPASPSPRSTQAPLTKGKRATRTETSLTLFKRKMAKSAGRPLNTIVPASTSMVVHGFDPELASVLTSAESGSTELFDGSLLEARIPIKDQCVCGRCWHGRLVEPVCYSYAYSITPTGDKITHSEWSTHDMLSATTIVPDIVDKVTRIKYPAGFDPKQVQHVPQTADCYSGERKVHATWKKRSTTRKITRVSVIRQAHPLAMELIKHAFPDRAATLTIQHLVVDSTYSQIYVSVHGPGKNMCPLKGGSGHRSSRVYFSFNTKRAKVSIKCHHQDCASRWKRGTSAIFALAEERKRAGGKKSRGGSRMREEARRAKAAKKDTAGKAAAEHQRALAAARTAPASLIQMVESCTKTVPRGRMDTLATLCGLKSSRKRGVAPDGTLARNSMVIDKKKIRAEKIARLPPTAPERSIALRPEYRGLRCGSLRFELYPGVYEASPELKAGLYRFLVTLQRRVIYNRNLARYMERKDQSDIDPLYEGKKPKKVPMVWPTADKLRRLGKA